MALKTACHDIVLDSKCLTNLEGDIGNIISKYFKLKLHVGAFKLYDTNRDGAITKEEMLNMIKSMVSMMGNKIKHDDLTAEKRVENIFNHMDKASLLNIAFRLIMGSSRIMMVN